MSVDRPHFPQAIREFEDVFGIGPARTRRDLDLLRDGMDRRGPEVVLVLRPSDIDEALDALRWLVDPGFRFGTEAIPVAQLDLDPDSLIASALTMIEPCQDLVGIFERNFVGSAPTRRSAVRPFLDQTLVSFGQ